MDSGVTWERLTPGPDPLVEALFVTYPPGSSSSSDGTLMSHAGREFGYLLSGSLTVHLGFETYSLEPGSSVSFDSAIPHSYVNEGAEPAYGIWHGVGRSITVPTPPAQQRQTRRSPSKTQRGVKQTDRRVSTA
jgi:uncharacterized cupin superfamily protein